MNSKVSVLLPTDQVVSLKLMYCVAARTYVVSLVVNGACFSQPFLDYHAACQQAKDLSEFLNAPFSYERDDY